MAPIFVHQFWTAILALLVREARTVPLILKGWRIKGFVAIVLTSVFVGRAERRFKVVDATVELHEIGPNCVVWVVRTDVHSEP